MTLRLPYLPYARQDRVTVAGEPLSVKVFCTLINAMKFDRVVVADPHSTVAPALLDRVEIESAEGFLGQVLALPGRGGVALVAPDAGAHKRVLALGERFGAPVCAAPLRNTARACWTRCRTCRCWWWTTSATAAAPSSRWPRCCAGTATGRWACT